MGKFDSGEYKKLSESVYGDLKQSDIRAFGIQGGTNTSVDWILHVRGLMKSNVRFATVGEMNRYIFRETARRCMYDQSQRVFVYIDCPFTKDGFVVRVPAKEWLRTIRYRCDKDFPIDVRGLTNQTRFPLQNCATGEMLPLDDLFKSTDARLRLFASACEDFLTTARDDLSIPSGTEFHFVGWTALSKTRTDAEGFPVPELVEGVRKVVFMDHEDDDDDDDEKSTELLMADDDDDDEEPTPKHNPKAHRRVVITDYSVAEAALLYGNHFQICEEADYMIVSDQLAFLDRGITGIVCSCDGDQTVQCGSVVWRKAAVCSSNLADIAPLYINRAPYGAYRVSEVYERIWAYLADYCCPRPAPSPLTPYPLDPAERGWRVGDDSYIGLRGNKDVQWLCRKLGWCAQPFPTWTFLEFLAFGSDHVVPFYETVRTMRLLDLKRRLRDQRRQGLITEAQEDRQIDDFKAQYNKGHYSRMFPFPGKALFERFRADSRYPYGLVYCPPLNGQTNMLQVPFVVDVDACLELIHTCLADNNIQASYTEKFGRMGDREFRLYIHQATFCLGWYLNMIIATRPSDFTLPHCCVRTRDSQRSMYGWKEVPNYDSEGEGDQSRPPNIEVDYDLDTSRPLVCSMAILDDELNERIHTRHFSQLYRLQGLDPRFFIGTRYQDRHLRWAAKRRRDAAIAAGFADPDAETECSDDEDEAEANDDDSSQHGLCNFKRSKVITT